MELWQILVLSVVQGITEFLPISSTAHLRIFPALAGWPDPGAAFTAILQLGSLLALILYFRRECNDLFSESLYVIRGHRSQSTSRQLFWGVVLGTVPVLLSGYFLRDWIKGPFRSLWVIAFALIGVGLLLAMVEKWSARKRTESEIRIADGIWIGLAQCLALVPGVSRSGISLFAGLAVGFQRDVAARYSFVMGIPALFAAGVFELWEIRNEIHLEAVMELALGILVTTIVSYLSIGFLIRFLKTNSSLVFVAYRVILGFALIGLLLAGVL